MCLGLCYMLDRITCRMSHGSVLDTADLPKIGAKYYPSRLALSSKILIFSVLKFFDRRVNYLQLTKVCTFEYLRQIIHRVELDQPLLILNRNIKI